MANCAESSQLRPKQLFEETALTGGVGAALCHSSASLLISAFEGYPGGKRSAGRTPAYRKRMWHPDQLGAFWGLCLGSLVLFSGPRTFFVVAAPRSTLRSVKGEAYWR